MVEPRWDPEQYLRFSDHRLRPAMELLQRIGLYAPEVIVDLGCGAGNVTQLLAARWPSAQIYAVDSSAEMLEQARARSSEIHWQQNTIERWVPERTPDLIYSNAALHWVAGHHELIPRLAQFLNKQGCLAVQMPVSWDAASHRLMRETLESVMTDVDQSVGDALTTVAARKWVEAPDVYYELLAAHAASVDVWQTEYLHELHGEDPVLAWMKGSGLRPIISGLGQPQLDSFLAEYQRRLRDAYPQQASGLTLYPFRRLFMIACM